MHIKYVILIVFACLSCVSINQDYDSPKEFEEIKGIITYFDNFNNKIKWSESIKNNFFNSSRIEKLFTISEDEIITMVYTENYDDDGATSWLSQFSKKDSILNNTWNIQVQGFNLMQPILIGKNILITTNNIIGNVDTSMHNYLWIFYIDNKKLHRFTEIKLNNDIYSCTYINYDGSSGKIMIEYKTGNILQGKDVLRRI